MKTCLDLFSGLGGFSQAFEESERWEVTTVEIESKFNPDIQSDIMDLTASDLPDSDLVLASPPCTLFSLAGNHDQWENKQPVGDRAKDAITLVYHTIGIIKGLNPDYWFLENPRGRLKWVLGEPEGMVHYCQYGKPYKKPTYLWGEHPERMEYRKCSAKPGSGCHSRNAEDDGTAATGSMDNDHAKRSKVPYELSESILKAVEGKQEQKSISGEWL